VEVARRGVPVVHGGVPDAPAPTTPTDTAALWREASIAWEGLRLVGAVPRLFRRAEVTSTVVLVPGYLTSSSTLEPLRRCLAWRGHDARHWGLGTNRGDPEADTLRMLPRVEALVAEVGAPVALVGWSLGGVIAREVARERPDLVQSVVTFGTPVVGGPVYTLVGGKWPEAERERIAAMIRERNEQMPIRVPVTAVFSRKDRIVAWPACLDRWSSDVEHVEVGSAHLGMIADPDVWDVVVRRVEGEGRRSSPRSGAAVKRVGAEGV